MPAGQQLLRSVTASASTNAWSVIAEHLWSIFSAPVPAAGIDAEVVRRDRDLAELENVVACSAWELWNDFESAVPKASQSIVDFWSRTSGGKAVLILDGLSLREVPWLLGQAEQRGRNIHQATARAAQLPCETTQFARALGFSSRSSLANNLAGSSHKLKGAGTESSNLPWKDCFELVGNQEGFIFWHHWPDDRMHDLSKPGEGLHRLARDTHAALTSTDFWAFVDRLATGRRLVITSDHGYAACGHFPDLVDKDQAAYMKALFKSGRTSVSDPGGEHDGSWVPPIDLRLTTTHGTHDYVLGRRKWKSPAGYPTLHHGGLSLLEVFVPFIELT